MSISVGVTGGTHHHNDAGMYNDNLQDLINEAIDEGDESADPGNEDIPTTTANDVVSARQAEQQELRNHQLTNSILTRQDDGPPGRQDGHNLQGQRIIDKAREYQQELYERAKDENIIAVLDTGMGKTLIAVMLIRDALEKGLVDAADGAPQKSIFFLANR